MARTVKAPVKKAIKPKVKKPKKMQVPPPKPVTPKKLPEQSYFV